MAPSLRGPRLRVRALLISALACLALGLVDAARATAAPVSAPAATGISVANGGLFLNGRPWVPRGVQITGLVATSNALAGKYIAANQNFGQSELGQAVAYGADLVRIQVSEFGLDPDSTLYDPSYLGEIESGVQLARANGLHVIVSLQAELPSGSPTRCALPDSGAARDWATLAAAFASDGDVMFELYNEPGTAATAAQWAIWRYGGISTTGTGACQAVGMQSLVNEIRAVGAPNVIILPALSGETSLAGVPKVTDPADPTDPQLAYGIHYPNLTQESTEWDTEFGDAAGKVPVIITEWQANSLLNCIPNAPTAAALLLDYLASKDIGVVGFAIDLPGTIIADYSYAPTSYANFTCGAAGGGAGQLLFGNYAGVIGQAAGSGRDVPRAWLLDANTISRLEALDGPATARALNTNRTYVTYASSAQLTALSVPDAVATESFTSETALAQATATGTLRPGTAAVELTLSDASPLAEQRQPLITFELGAQAAHRNGLLFIAAPQLSIITTFSPGTRAADLDAAFLRRRLAASAATYADAVVLPFADEQATPTAYGALASVAAMQAESVHPGIELIGGLTVAGASPPPAATLVASVAAADADVAGYALTDPGAGGDTDALGLLTALYGPAG